MGTERKCEITVEFPRPEGLEFIKTLEDGTLGMNFHDTKSEFGVFPYGYSEALHNQWQRGDEWKKSCENILNDDHESTWYTKEDGWSDDAANGMFSELMTYLSNEVFNLAQSTLKQDVCDQLTEHNWEAVCSVAWDIGIGPIEDLFNKLNNSNDVIADGAAWIKSKNTNGTNNPKMDAYVVERRRCESEWWMNGSVDEYRNVNDLVNGDEAAEAIRESSLKSANYTPEGGNGKTLENAQKKPLTYSHRSIVYTRTNSGKFLKTNLFSSKIYYLQNVDSEDSATVAEINDGVNRSMHSKALLYLHTLPFNYQNVRDNKISSFFNWKDINESDTEGESSQSNKRHGGKEEVPYGFLLMVGGLIWRKRWCESHEGSDPIRYGVPGKASLFKAPANGADPILMEDENGNLLFCVADNSSNAVYKTAYNDIVNEKMDIYTENTLVQEFESFVYNQFSDIMRECELRCGFVNNEPQPADTIGTSVTYNPDQSEISGNVVIRREQMDYQRFMCLWNALETAKSEPLSKTMSYLYGIEPVAYRTGANDAEYTNFVVQNFANNYLVGFYDVDDKVVNMYFSDTNVIHRHYTDLLSHPVVVLTTGINQKGKSSTGVIKKKFYDDYIKGFTNTISVYARKQASKDTYDYKEGGKELPGERELNLALYLELKNIWDRWLCGFFNSDSESDRHYFDVKSKTDKTAYQNTLFSNFVFIDSFYCDISHLLKLNCDKILERYNEDVSYSKNGGRNRVNVHLGGIASDHKCMMYNFPDFIGFDGDRERVEEFMNELFLPLPSSKVDLPKVMNKFVVIYANFAGMVDNGVVKNFNKDSFNIYSYKDGTAIAPVVFNKKSAAPGLYEKPRMGYYVPAFCVEYSRQTNSYWMNFGVSMENNANTSQAVLALSYIAEKGNSSKRQVCFYGQDIYPVYQAYSYIVTIEMMGDAQIQPLMYFQLLNIPMFNGAYMVMSVDHSISAGKMTTTIKGMKMSKVRVPFTKYWFAVSEEGRVGSQNNEADFTNDDSAGITATHSEYINIADENLEEAIRNAVTSQHVNCDTFVRQVYGSNGIEVNIKHTLKGKETNMFAELNDPSNTEWEVHQLPEIACKHNRWKPLYSGNDHPRCGDLLFGYHDGVRVSSTDSFDHVSIFLGFAAERSSDLYVAEGDSVGGSSFRDDPKGAHVSCMQDSKMGLGTDMITHWARCKKYSVKQKSDIKGEEDDPRIVESSVFYADIDALSMTAGNNAGGYEYSSQPVQNSVTGQQQTVETWTVHRNDLDIRAHGYTPTGKTYYTIKSAYDRSKHGVPNGPVTYEITRKDGKKYSMTYNVPRNMQMVVDKILNPAADMYLFKYAPTASGNLKVPQVTHFYRNKSNKKGSERELMSQHYKGEAADLQCNGSGNRNLYNMYLAKVIVEYLDWDQLICENIDANEYRNGKLRFSLLHVSYATDTRKNQRRRIDLSYTNGSPFFRSFVGESGRQEFLEFLNNGLNS